MALTALTGTIAATTLNNNLDDKTATLETNAAAGKKDHTIFLRVVSLADTTEERDRTIAWVAPDNLQVRIAALRVTDGTSSRVVTATLSVDGTTSLVYLGENTVSISVTTVNGTVDSRTSSATDYRTGSPWLRVFKGVRYRLTLENTSGATTVTGPVLAMLHLRSERRRA